MDKLFDKHNYGRWCIGIS